MGKEKSVIMRKLVVSVIIIGILSWRCTDGCLDYERNALMELMGSLYLPWSNVFGEDCCHWPALECSSSSGQITKLYISGGYNYYFNASLFLPFHQLNILEIGFINIVGCVHDQCFERLSELKKLESLDLSRNHCKNRSFLSSIASISSLKSLNLYGIGFEGTDEIQWLSKLENLEDLNLGGNNFNNSKLLSLPVISSLKTLSLVDCGLKGTVDIQGLSKLEKLEKLDLSSNDFNNPKLLSLPALSSLNTLELKDCGLKGTVDIQELDALANLEELDLSGNQIDRIFMGSRGVNVSRNLKALYLDNITYNGRSNVQLHSLGQLELISLTHNQFEGPIFVEEGNLTNVEELVLDYSSLDKESFQSLLALPSLKYLSLTDVNATQPAQGLSNTLYTIESTFLRDIGMMISLKTLTLANSGLKGTIPTTEGLCLLRHLEELDISHNELSGTLPWCIANLTSLKKLDLSWNRFNGSISPLRSLTSLQELRFPSNQFQIPISLEPFFNHSKLKYLNAENNSQIYEDEEINEHNLSPKFQLQTLYLSSPGNGGAFPKFLYHQHDLQVVDLSNIKLKGEFPYWLLVNNTKLSILYLANTSLSMPFQLSSNSSKYLLESLDISHNKFNGAIPTNIGKVLPNLQVLNLSENGFMGNIPSSFAKMRDLRSLDLSNNRLSGIIPEDLYIGCSSLALVILSHNDFEGQILPKQGNLSMLAYLLLDDNQFTGNIPNSLLNCTWLSILDVSNNHLFGSIPRWIANMSHLQVLDLSSNSFSENLPSHFCPYVIRELYLSNNQLQGSLDNAFYNCSKLKILDLSHNYLTGTISKWIGNLTDLTYILLSFNQLQGALPNELCNLGQLCLVDLSNNNLSGSLLSCLKFSSKHMQTEVEYDVTYYSGHVPRMQRSLEFTTKGITREIRGRVLKLISGIDFSCNKFTGEIPIEIGNLSMIQALNLSHNSLTGPIPQSFMNLKEIESLDLSYNKLNGKIPPRLTQLHFVSNFSVAHNNLFGKTPEMVGQFATFDKSSYEGNPLLCGLPLLKSCQTENSHTNSVEEEEGGFIDMIDFYMSFLISYVIALLSIAAVLYINPYWRRAWFYFIEVSLRNFYYFIEDIIIALRKLRVS